MKLSDLQDQQRMMSQEAVELCEQCNNYVNEIECLNGASELAIYRAVENERNKMGGARGSVAKRVAPP